MMLMGSVARGIEYLTSGLDLFILLSDCVHREFSSEIIDGILVEYIYLNSIDTLKKLNDNDNDMEVYHSVDSKILYDNDDKMKRLYDYAYFRSGIKIKASIANSDSIKSNFLTDTTSWKVLEAIWAINDIPMPPAGSSTPRLNRLKIIHGNNWFQTLFDGDSRQRIISILDIIEWAIPKL